MATNYTTNYQLNQWEPTDQVQRTDFNADNSKIDAALAQLGIFRLESGTYVGTGGITGGPLAFSKPPVVAMIRPSSGADVLLLFGGNSSGIFIQGAAPTTSQVGRMQVTWTGSTATWYKSYTELTNDSSMSKSGVTYHYLALVPNE